MDPSPPRRALRPCDHRLVLHEGVTVDALQAVLTEHSAFTRAFDFQIQSIEPGACTLLVPFNPLFERPGGILSGQVFMTAADVAMWLAIKTKRGLHDTSVTVSMQTSFLRSGRREPITCTARVLRLGARLCHGAAECFSPGGILLTHHSLTYMRPEPRSTNAHAGLPKAAVFPAP
jgi:acyl-coenzyme A thioesterase PaaI-like protein